MASDTDKVTGRVADVLTGGQPAPPTMPAPPPPADLTGATAAVQPAPPPAAPAPSWLEEGPGLMGSTGPVLTPEQSKAVASRLQEPVKQSEVEKIPGLQPDTVTELENQGRAAGQPTLRDIFGKERGDMIREHIAFGFPPEVFTRAAIKTWTDWYSPAMLAVSAPGRIAHGYKAASEAAQKAGMVEEAAKLAGKARLSAILGTGTGVAIGGKQAHDLVENWDSMTPADRTASILGLVGIATMTGVGVHAGVTAGKGPKESTETKLGPQGTQAGEAEQFTEMNRDTVAALRDLGYSNQAITQFNISEIRDILKNKTQAPPPAPSGAPAAAPVEPSAPAVETPAAGADTGIAPITFDSVGGVERRNSDSWRPVGKPGQPVDQTYQTIRESEAAKPPETAPPATEIPGIKDAPDWLKKTAPTPDQIQEHAQSIPAIPMTDGGGALARVPKSDAPLTSVSDSLARDAGGKMVVAPRLPEPTVNPMTAPAASGVMPPLDPAKIQGGAPPSQEAVVKHFETKYPAAPEMVDGRTVRDQVPNMSSIAATLAHYEILDGVREIPLADFPEPPAETARSKKLAEDIKQSGEINPLIVGIDNRGGPYIIEGSHRYDALKMLGAKSFPAVVAIDTALDYMPGTPAPKDAEVLPGAAEISGTMESKMTGNPDPYNVDAMVQRARAHLDDKAVHSITEPYAYEFGDGEAWITPDGRTVIDLPEDRDHAGMAHEMMTGVESFDSYHKMLQDGWLRKNGPGSYETGVLTPKVLDTIENSVIANKSFGQKLYIDTASGGRWTVRDGWTNLTKASAYQFTGEGQERKMIEKPLSAIASNDAELSGTMESKKASVGSRMLEKVSDLVHAPKPGELPAFVFPDGQIISDDSGLLHEDIAKQAGAKSVQAFLAKSSGVRITYGDAEKMGMPRGKEDNFVGVELTTRPSQYQIQSVADAVKRTGGTILWSIDDQGGEGSIGDFQRAVDKAFPEVSGTMKSQKAPVHPALQAVASKYRTGPVSDTVKYEPSFIQPDGKVIYLGTDWHPSAIEKTGAYPGTEEGRTQFINDTKSIRVRPNMQPREDETFHFTVPKTGLTLEQVDAMKKVAATARYSNLMVETADTPNLSRNNMRTPQEWQYKSANDVDGILAKLGVLPGQKISLADAYGETGKYVGGHEGERVDLGTMESSKWDKQAKGAPAGVTNRQKYVADLGVTHGDKLLEIPASFISPKSSTRGTLFHENGHVIEAALNDIPTKGTEVWSHLHPELLGSDASAGTHFAVKDLPGATPSPKGAYFTPEGLRQVFPRLLRTWLGGAVSQEVMEGIPFEENSAKRGDLQQIHGAGKAAGLSTLEVDARITKELAQVRADLNHPKVRAILQTSTATREEGLSKTLHQSAAKVQSIVQKVKEIRHEVRPETLPVVGEGHDTGDIQGNRPSIESDVAGGPGEVQNGAAGGNQPIQGTLFSQRKPRAGEVEPPKKLYHYTTKDFTEFNPLIGGRGGDFGIHFGTPEQANDRMQGAKDSPTMVGEDVGGRIHPVYVDIKNPVRVADHTSFSPGEVAAQLTDMGVFSPAELQKISDREDLVDPKKLRALLESKGYDGLVYLNRSEGLPPEWAGGPNIPLTGTDADFLKAYPDAKGNDSYIALRPEQVKSQFEKPKEVEGTLFSKKVKPNEQTMYHITPSENVPNIMREGLKPQVGARGAKVGEAGGVHLFKNTDDADDALMGWLGDEFEEDQPLSMLKVSIPADAISLPGAAGYEHIHGEPIHPEKISVYRENADIPEKRAETEISGTMESRKTEPGQQAMPLTSLKIIGGSHEAFLTAVENTPFASYTEKGLTLNLTRFQKPEQAGGIAARGGIFYLAGRGTGSYYDASERYGRPIDYGGSEKMQDRNTFKNPLIVRGGTGGAVQGRFLDSLLGQKDTLGRIYSDALSVIHATQNKTNMEVGDGSETVPGAIAEFLKQRGGAPAAAYDIWANSKTPYQMATAIYDNVVGQKAKDLGHDAIVGYSSAYGRPSRFTEVFDLTTNQFPEVTGPLGATTLLQAHPLLLEGTGEGGRTTIFDFAKAMNEWAQQGLKPKKEIRIALDRARAEMTYQMANDNSGTDWYKQDTRDAIDHLKANGFPELKDPLQDKLFRVMWGITSYGVNPDINLTSAAEAYKQYKETGSMPLKADSKTNWPGYSGIQGSITLLNKLIEDKGEQGAMDWLLSKHPVSEIRDQKLQTHTVHRVAGKATDEKYGAFIFGPKGGPDVLNLQGVTDHTTVDVWGARTIRRWTGTLTPETMDQPVTAVEAEKFHGIVEAIAKEKNLDISDVQASLWIYEHDLYAAHGVGEAAKSYKGAAEKYVQRQQEGTTRNYIQEQSSLFGERYGEKGKAAEKGRPPSSAGGRAPNHPAEHGWKELSPGLKALISPGKGVK